MVLGVLTVQLHIPASSSLKSKRSVIKSLKERIRQRFNTSVAETGHHDKWQLSEMVVVNAAGSRRLANQTLDSVLSFIESFNGVVVADYRLELL